MKTSAVNILLTTALLPLFCFAQSPEKLIREGNKSYREKKYNEAEIRYRKSLEKKQNDFTGNYNLGNALYQEGKLEEAKGYFEAAAANKSADKTKLAQAYHNLGNTYLKNQKYAESVQSYKQALRLNPGDNDTRYNLAYAQSMLKQQQQQNKGDDKKEDQKKQDEQQKEEQQKQKEEQKEDNQAQQQKPKDKISKEDAEKILQALNNDEKKTQKKLNVKQATKATIEKNW